MCRLRCGIICAAPRPARIVRIRVERDTRRGVHKSAAPVIPVVLIDLICAVVAESIVAVVVAVVGFHLPDTAHEILHALDRLARCARRAARRRACLGDGVLRHQSLHCHLFEGCLEHEGEKTKEHDVEGDGKDTVQPVGGVFSDVLFPRKGKGRE